HEAAGESAVKQRFSQLERQLLEVNEVDRMGDNIARLTAPKPLAGRAVVLRHESRKQLRRAIQTLRAGKTLEDLGELLRVRTLQKHLVLQTPQEGFVTELLRLKVG